MTFIFHPAAGIKTSCTHSNFKQIPIINCSTSDNKVTIFSLNGIQALQIEFLYNKCD